MMHWVPTHLPQSGFGAAVQGTPSSARSSRRRGAVFDRKQQHLQLRQPFRRLIDKFANQSEERPVELFSAPLGLRMPQCTGVNLHAKEIHHCGDDSVVELRAVVTADNTRRASTKTDAHEGLRYTSRIMPFEWHGFSPL